MENEKMQVNFAPGMTEATLRVIELHEENELPVLEPDKVELAGTIGSVYEFLLKRISEKEQINQKRCYILVDREKMTLKLVTNETDSRNKATVRGELKYYPKFLEFGINTSKTWEPVQLSKFFKMNRAFFKDAQYNMELVTVLKNFKASIDSKVENSRQDNGSRTDNYSNNNEDCKEILEAGTCRIGFLHWQPRIQSHKCVVGNFNNHADSSIYSL